MNTHDDIVFNEHKKMNLSNSMLVVAFPTVGLISSIAGRYIVDTVKLEEIGDISSRYFMPATIIHNSMPSPPVRIYAGEKVCGQDKSCDQLVVIISEFMPPWELIQPLVNKIFDWAAEKGCKLIVTLEGMHTVSTTKPRTFGVATTPNTKNILKKYKIDEIKEGMITGDTGVFLYDGVKRKRDVICLLAEAHASFPDSRAAGLLLEQLDKLLPVIDFNLEPLYKEADEIEKRIKAFINQSKPTAPTVGTLPTQMYG